MYILNIRIFVHVIMSREAAALPSRAHSETRDAFEVSLHVGGQNKFYYLRADHQILLKPKPKPKPDPKVSLWGTKSPKSELSRHPKTARRAKPAALFLCVFSVGTDTCFEGGEDVTVRLFEGFEGQACVIVLKNCPVVVQQSQRLQGIRKERVVPSGVSHIVAQSCSEAAHRISAENDQITIFRKA